MCVRRCLRAAFELMLGEGSRRAEVLNCLQGGKSEDHASALEKWPLTICVLVGLSKSMTRAA